MKKIILSLLLIATCTASTNQSTVKAYKVTYNDIDYIKFIVDIKNKDFIIIQDKFYIDKILGDKVFYFDEVVEDGKIKYKLYSNNTIISDTLEVLE